VKYTVVPAAHMQCGKLRAKINQPLTEKEEEWKMTLGFPLRFSLVKYTVVPAAHIQCEKLRTKINQPLTEMRKNGR
jgi:hypothetical protein